MELQGPYFVFQLLALTLIYLYRRNTVVLNIEIENPNPLKKQSNPQNPHNRRYFCICSVLSSSMQVSAS